MSGEEQHTPLYEAALEGVGLDRGDRLLDLGCGTGVFLRMCADRGVVVSGLDAAEGLLALARARVPEADLRLGDLQALPYADDSFDVVTGFTSFFYADDTVGALREAGRVARAGAPVVIAVWGRPERCEMEAVKQAVAAFRGAEPPNRATARQAPPHTKDGSPVAEVIQHDRLFDNPDRVVPRQDEGGWEQLDRLLLSAT